jgi:ribosomal protein S18 acetylase RimI-like enzyme
MTCCNGGAVGPLGTNATSVIFQDAKTLSAARREAIRTSPGSFLITLRDIDAKGRDYWIDEVQSSTWVVAERDGKAVGVAACKSPHPGKDKESDQDSRYIESLWIDPDLRGHRLGERLLRYLMATEFRKNSNIERFLLWVFETNPSAISLYKRMQFDQTRDRNEGFRTEIKYHLSVSPETRLAICQTVDSAALLSDKQKYGVTYRVLGEGDSA